MSKQSRKFFQTLMPSHNILTLSRQTNSEEKNIWILEQCAKGGVGT